MSFLLNQTIQEILLQQFQHDTWIVPMLDQTCWSYREQLPPTREIRQVEAWLEEREGLDDPVEQGRSEIFSYCEIQPGRTARTWRLWARSGRRSVRLFYTSGMITLHPNCCSMVLLGEDGDNAFKDSFRRIVGLQGLMACMHAHTILCHQMPEHVPKLSGLATHRHRDTVAWSSRRAFRVWWASLPANHGKTWSYHPAPPDASAHA